MDDYSKKRLCHFCCTFCLTYIGTVRVFLSWGKALMCISSQQQQNIKCRFKILLWAFCRMLHLLSQASLHVSYSAPTRTGGIFGFSCGRQVLFLEVTSYKLFLMAGVCLVESWIQQLRRSLISASFRSLQEENEIKLLFMSIFLRACTSVQVKTEFMKACYCICCLILRAQGQYF